MPPSFLSKFVNKPQDQSRAPNRTPSPSPARRRTLSTKTNSSLVDLADAPPVPKLTLNPGNPGADSSSRHLSINPTDSDGQVPQRASLIDGHDFPTPTENDFRRPPIVVNGGTLDSADAAGGASLTSIPAADSSANHNSSLVNGVSDKGGSTLNAAMEIVESPEPIRPTFANDPVSPALLPQSEREQDAVSIASSKSKKKTQRTWRSNSTSNKKRTMPAKKPSGIAGALAASGLAIANPPSGINMTPSIQQSLPPPSSATSRQRAPSSGARSATFAGPPSSGRPRDASLTSLDSNNPYDEGSEDGYDSPDLDLNDDDIPITGFAVASNKRNQDFHELFRNVPDGDYLIDDYGCALQREILIQGRMYISENHVCFHANIFGWVTDVTIPMYDIIALEKKTTAFVIPNAIQITTRKAKYNFASFLARDTVYDVMHNIWRTARPEATSSIGGSASQSVEDSIGSPPAADGSLPPLNVGSAKSAPTRRANQCACGKKGEHYAEKALETVVPGTPEKVYTLLFQSAFMKEFMREEQKLTDIQISDWMPSAPDSLLLKRNMTYIKPLNAPVGPKQTKCEIQDETVHLDYEDYVSTVTTTRTPDVPSGSVFMVKTRTCLMWAGSNSTRIIVTTTVEWTGRSFIKSIIERSALEGQKTYHADLERHIKHYISSHLSEFLPEGESSVAIAEEAAAQLVESPTVLEPSHEHQHLPRDRRGLQWALDTFTGAYKVGKESAIGAIDLLKDAWDSSSSQSLLYGLLVVLIISNVYTFLAVGKREEVGRRKAESRKSIEREQWIGDTVKVLLKELRETPESPFTSGAVKHTPPSPLPQPPHSETLETQKEELVQMHQTLDHLEARVAKLRDALSAIRLEVD